jgi:mono/diheme cytochrome c family protein
MLLAALPLALQVGSEASGQALRQGSGQAPGTAASAEFFEASVRPVLAANCYDCHADERMGGLRLDSREALLKGGRSGPALVPGDPDESLIIKAVRQSSEKLKMPKGGRLRPEEIEALTAWVRAGAPWFNASAAAATGGGAAATAPVAAAASAARSDAAAAVPAYIIKPEQRAFWSFQPLSTPPVPAVSHTSWAKSDIDRFILARLEKEGMAPVRAADKRTLLRRATLDLTGLPPTPDEIDAFEADSSPDAFAKVVDRLLASPRYGEAWGRMWLDVARYGEDDYRSLDPKGRGFNPYPNAYL